MSSLFEAMPYLGAYQPSFLVLALLTLTILVQNFLIVPLAFVRNEQVPGMPLRHDHTKLSFRTMRTHANSAESLPAFGWALMVAIIAGVSPGLVNWLAGIYLAFRLVYWGVYYGGMGKVAGGARSMVYVGGWLANLVLSCAAIFVLLTD